ncbi:hypothetical protein BaRGS_00019134 [Batillaria attramentaria]|uniref:Uncharacterized protein n=1 Tax=Batillaria attramentaria TaxID=370345 RepID=A0ABD0KRC9_9CAEN
MEQDLADPRETLGQPKHCHNHINSLRKTLQVCLEWAYAYEFVLSHQVTFCCWVKAIPGKTPDVSKSQTDKSNRQNRLGITCEP